MKSYLRRSKASKSTLRKIESILRRGPRETRRAVSASRRLAIDSKGGLREW
jgi:hypothetical protein